MAEKHIHYHNDKQPPKPTFERKAASLKKIMMIFLVIIFSGMIIAYSLADIDDPFITQTVGVNDNMLNLPRSDLNGLTLNEVFEQSTIPALENKVVNGDFSDGTNGWTVSSSTINVTNNTLLITGNGSSPYAGAVSVNTNLITGNVYYVKSRIRTLSALTYSMRLWAGMISNFINISSLIQNQWYEISQGLISNGGDVLVQHRYNSSTDANGAVMEVDYIMYFDLTASHGVTATSGTAYDNAVADIEALIDINNGYIDEVFNFYQWGRENDLTKEQLDYYYDLYKTYFESNQQVTVYKDNWSLSDKETVGTGGLTAVTGFLREVEKIGATIETAKNIFIDIIENDIILTMRDILKDISEGLRDFYDWVSDNLGIIVKQPPITLPIIPVLP